MNSTRLTQLISGQISHKISLFSLIPLPPWRGNRPFVRLSPSECEFRSGFGRLVRLDGQIVLQKLQTDGQIQTTKSSKNLFVPFSHQAICPSETICPSVTIWPFRWFVRLLVWKRPLPGSSVLPSSILHQFIIASSAFSSILVNSFLAFC